MSGSSFGIDESNYNYTYGPLNPAMSVPSDPPELVVVNGRLWLMHGERGERVRPDYGQEVLKVGCARVSVEAVRLMAAELEKREKGC